MFWLKACPRCRGDLFRQVDLYGLYIACLQCGYVLRPEEESRLLSGLKPMTKREAVPAARAA